MQVNGSHVCSSPFSRPRDGNQAPHQALQPPHRFFPPPVQTVTIMPPREDARIPDQTSTAQIEESPLNRTGGNVRQADPGLLSGEVDRAAIAADGLAPRSAGGAAKSRSMSRGIISTAWTPSLTRVSLFEPRQELVRCLRAGHSAYIAKHWPVGTRVLLAHLFGWRKVEGVPAASLDKINEIFDLVTGHSAPPRSSPIRSPAN